MGRLAFVFSGQGDQFPGMGKDIVCQYKEAGSVFRMCDSIRPKTSDQCFFGDKEELNRTVNTQPCLFAMELAAAQTLKGRDIYPDVVAGFSLGEVTACTFAGAMSAQEGFRLIIRRGELMQKAADKQDTFMAAVLKLETKQVIALCNTLSDVYPVNFNCPGQVTVSGASGQLPALREAVRKEGGRVLPLKVSGAFHSPFMEEAAAAFGKELQSVSFCEPAMEVFSNVTARPYQNNFAQLLSEQIVNPVLWETEVRNMIASGVDTFIEIGSGRTLTNMIRKIDRTVKTYAVANLSEIIKDESV